jgi:hypothetical protein
MLIIKPPLKNKQKVVVPCFDEQGEGGKVKTVLSLKKMVAHKDERNRYVRMVVLLCDIFGR